MDLGKPEPGAISAPVSSRAADWRAIHYSRLSAKRDPGIRRDGECRAGGIDATDRRPERLGQNPKRNPARRIGNTNQPSLERSTRGLAQGDASRASFQQSGGGCCDERDRGSVADKIVTGPGTVSAFRTGAQASRLPSSAVESSGGQARRLRSSPSYHRVSVSSTDLYRCQSKRQFGPNPGVSLSPSNFPIMFGER